jgi:hypothetical protein
MDTTFYADEAWLYVSGHVNTKNASVVCGESSRNCGRALTLRKIGIWAAISRRHIIGLIFFTETIDSECYCWQILFPFIGQLNEDEFNSALFEQDCATPHTAHRLMELLEDVFGERLVSRGIWPPYLPDLSSPDYFLWGAAESKVYENYPERIAELKTAIESCVQSVTAETLRELFDSKVSSH